MAQSAPSAANAVPLAARPGADAPGVADVAVVRSLVHPAEPVPITADAAAIAVAEEPALAPAAAVNPHALGPEPELALAPAAVAGAAGPVPAGVVQPQAHAAGVLQALRAAAAASGFLAEVGPLSSCADSLWWCRCPFFIKRHACSKKDWPGAS